MNTSKRHHGAHPSRRPPTALADLEHPERLVRIADAICAQLAAARADHLALRVLMERLHTNAGTIKAAVVRCPELGLAGGRERPVVYCVNPAAVAAGFQPVLSGRRMILRLGSGSGAPWPLTVSGAHLGNPAHRDAVLDGVTDRAVDGVIAGIAEPGLPEYGRGELGYTINRLTLMARRWLILTRPPSQHESTLRLFELIARAWHGSPGPTWFSGRLHAHRVELNLPVGTRFWNDDAPTSRLELIVWADRELGFQLVNVYPAGTYRSIFGIEES